MKREQNIFINTDKKDDIEFSDWDDLFDYLNILHRTDKDQKFTNERTAKNLLIDPYEGDFVYLPFGDLDERMVMMEDTKYLFEHSFRLYKDSELVVGKSIHVRAIDLNDVSDRDLMHELDDKFVQHVLGKALRRAVDIESCILIMFHWDQDECIIHTIQKR